MKYLYVYLYITILSRSVTPSPSPPQPHPEYLQEMVLGAIFMNISPITNIYKKIKNKNLLTIVFYWLIDYLVFTTYRKYFSDTTVAIGFVFNTLYNTYLTIDAKGDEHQEEQDCPQCRQRKTLDGFRVHNERQTRSCNMTSSDYQIIKKKT